MSIELKEKIFKNHEKTHSDQVTLLHFFSNHYLSKVMSVDSINSIHVFRRYVTIGRPKINKTQTITTSNLKISNSKLYSLKGMHHR